MAEGILDYVLSDHAEEELARRKIARDAVYAVLTRPEQRFEARPGRDVLQSRIGEQQLLRVFVDVDRQPQEVVTAYVTSKIEKYWRPKP